MIRELDRFSLLQSIVLFTNSSIWCDLSYRWVTIRIEYCTVGKKRRLFRSPQGPTVGYKIRGEEVISAVIVIRGNHINNVIMWRSLGIFSSSSPFHFAKFCVSTDGTNMHGQYFKDGLYYKEADAKSQRSYIELGTCCRFLLLTASQLTVCIYAIRKKKIL